MTIEQRVRELEKVGCKFYRSPQKWTRLGGYPRYHIVDGENNDGSPKLRSFDSVVEVEEFIKVKRAANAAHTPEDAEEIMSAGGFLDFKVQTERKEAS